MAERLPQSELRRRREALVREHIRCEQQGTDIDGAVATFEHGATYDVVPLEHLKPPGQDVTHPSSEAVHELLTMLTTAFPDLKLVIERLHHADDAVIVEGRTIGTHTGPLGDLPPTRRTIDVRAGVVYRFDGEVMTNETIYYDTATQMRQLGFTTLDLAEARNAPQTTD